MLRQTTRDTNGMGGTILWLGFYSKACQKHKRTANPDGDPDPNSVP